ncbi:MAG: flotillin family protein, partial [Myxococcales bacterium]|nr:flotillin family protein [Myxococcales bacterium]
FGAHQPALGGVVAAVGVTLAAAGAVVVSLVELIPPGSILVITGRPRPGPDGRPRGFRIVTGGRVIRMPLVEQAQHLDVRPRAIPVRVAGAYSRGGVPLEVDAIAQVRLASREPRVTHAVERFLGADRARVDEVAREILQGHLRELIARLTPAEAREDVVPLGRALAEKAEADLGRCGIEIDRAELVDIVGGA